MVIRRYKYLHEPKRGFFYVRKDGRYTRVMGEPGTQGFDRSYWEIMSGKRADSKFSMNALIVRFRGSDRWRELKPRTRQDYEKVMAYIDEKAGKRDVRTMRRKDFVDARDANQQRIRFANYISTVASILFEYAIEIGWCDDNPAKGIRKLKVPQHKKQEHTPPPDWTVDLWRKEAISIPRLIFELAIGTVQRPGDLVGFNWGDYDGLSLALRQNKTDKPLLLPCTPELRHALDEARAALCAAPHPSRPILTKSNGNRMDYRTLADIMRKERKRLGTLNHDNHSLRYRGVMELAWAGCDDDEIMSYSGHATKDMVRKYAGEARQIIRAKQAAAKRQVQNEQNKYRT